MSDIRSPAAKRWVHPNASSLIPDYPTGEPKSNELKLAEKELSKYLSDPKSVSKRFKTTIKKAYDPEVVYVKNLEGGRKLFIIKINNMFGDPPKIFLELSTRSVEKRISNGAKPSETISVDRTFAELYYNGSERDYIYTRKYLGNAEGLVNQLKLFIDAFEKNEKFESASDSSG